MTSEHGPFPLTGTEEWVTYSADVKGILIFILPDQLAGISGSGVAGYGGYFAGFSTVARIKKQSCPNVTLKLMAVIEPINGKDGVNINGATSKTFKPTESNIYTVELRNANCTQLQQG